MWCPLEYVVFLRHYDFCTGHFVVVGAGRSRDYDIVAGTNIFQRPEDRIAVSGDAGISMMSGKGGVRDMPGAYFERRALRSFDERDSETEPWDLHHAEKVAFMDQLQARMKRLPRRLPKQSSVSLLELRSPQCDGCAENQNARYRKDQRLPHRGPH